MERRSRKKKILKVILIIVIGTGIYLSLLLINPENIKKVRDKDLKGKKQKGYIAFQLIQDSISMLYTRCLTFDIFMTFLFTTQSSTQILHAYTLDGRQIRHDDKS